jgi:hypothetical protein
MVLLSVLSFYWGIRKSNLSFTKSVIIKSLFAILVLEIGFHGFAIPFASLKNEKRLQISEAKELTAIIPCNSAVLVVDAPHLYITCNYYNPFGDYTFILAGEKIAISRSNQLKETKYLAAYKNSKAVSPNELLSMGFNSIGVTSSGLVAYSCK